MKDKQLTHECKNETALGNRLPLPVHFGRRPGSHITGRNQCRNYIGFRYTSPSVRGTLVCVRRNIEVSELRLWQLPANNLFRIVITLGFARTAVICYRFRIQDTVPHSLSKSLIFSFNFYSPHAGIICIQLKFGVYKHITNIYYNFLYQAREIRV